MELKKQQQIQVQEIREDTRYELSSYRYVNLFIFLTVTAVNQLTVQNFSSMSRLIQDRYNYTAQLVTFISLLGPIVHPFFALPVSFILDKFGIKIGCCIGGVLVVAGSWAKLLMDVQEPAWAIFGTFLIAVGDIFVISSPSAFAIKWFKTQDGPKIISALALVINISCGGGISIAGFFLPQNSTIQQIQNFFMIQATIVTVPFVLFLILFRQSPQYPPCKAAANLHLDHSKQPYIQTVKSLIKNKSYIKVFFAMSFSFGIFVSYATLQNQILAVLEYQQPGKVNSLFALSCFTVGTIFSYFFINAVKKTLQFRNILSISLLGSIFCFILLNIVLFYRIDSTIVILVVGAALGIFEAPLTSLYITFSSQLTYPIAQGSATGLLYTGSQTFEFLVGMLWIYILDRDHKWKVYALFIFYLVLIVFGWVIIIHTKQYLNKTNYELGLTGQQRLGQKQSEQEQVQEQIQRKINTNIYQYNS